MSGKLVAKIEKVLKQEVYDSSKFRPGRCTGYYFLEEVKKFRKATRCDTNIERLASYIDYRLHESLVSYYTSVIEAINLLKYDKEGKFSPQEVKEEAKLIKELYEAFDSYVRCRFIFYYDSDYKGIAKFKDILDAKLETVGLKYSGIDKKIEKSIKEFSEQCGWLASELDTFLVALREIK